MLTENVDIIPVSTIHGENISSDEAIYLFWHGWNVFVLFCVFVCRCLYWTRTWPCFMTIEPPPSSFPIPSFRGHVVNGLTITACKTQVPLPSSLPLPRSHLHRRCWCSLNVDWTTRGAMLVLLLLFCWPLLVLELIRRRCCGGH